MSTHKNIERICVVALVFALIITCLFACGERYGIEKVKRGVGYEARLFDTGKVHTIDINMDDWDSFISSCQSEEYTVCDVIIDGEAYQNVAIRGKGNTSLTNVSSMGSERYSFKIEFDHYDSSNSYYGLDKLSLNNIIQDNTYMKDYLTYRLMNEFGVVSPLCSFTYITVGGEDWGLYLAVEGVEDAFLSRNYNSEGNLYKPDSMNLGGGRGNGIDFDFSKLDNDKVWERDNSSSDKIQEDFPFKEDNGNELPQPPNMGEMPNAGELPDMDNMPDIGDIKDGNIFSMGGGMGSDDVKLKYIDDSISSYSNIFDNAKTDITSKDKERLISSLKSLSAYENLEEVVDIDKVIRYFVVHNYVCNGDSYTGAMVHNYYLYENDGQLSMIPWDYNLAFGGFQSSSATSTVNSPIDSPVSSGSVDDRPMIGWIFSGDTYTQAYHEYFADFLTNIDIQGIISQAQDLISAYVEKDPTKFCTYDEYQKGVETLKEFCRLRSESIKGQLDGSVPSTQQGQSDNSSSLIDASSITISHMGTMSVGGIGGKGGTPMSGIEDNKLSKDENAEEAGDTAENTTTDNSSLETQMPDTPPDMPAGEQMPTGGEDPMGTPPNDNGNMKGEKPMDMPDKKPESMGGETNNIETDDKSQPTEEGSTTNTLEESTTQSREEGSTGDKQQGHGKRDDMMNVGRNNMEGVGYIIGSIALLVFGLIFAIMFKRRKGQ